MEDIQKLLHWGKKEEEEKEEEREEGDEVKKGQGREGKKNKANFWKIVTFLRDLFEPDS